MLSFAFMRNLTTFILTLVLISACVSSKQEFESYGSEITSDHAIPTEIFLTKVSESEESYKVKGTILEVCQMKGCWMTLQNEQGQNVRVTFKDYAFFVPKDISGSEVVLEGVAYKEVLAEDVARHYAEDGNQAYDESMRNSVSFVAEGVLVAKN